MVEVSVADDERPDRLRVDLAQFDVIEQGLGRVAEVQHHRMLCTAALRLHEQRQAPLVVYRAPVVVVARRRLDLDAAHRSRPQEQIVRPVDQHAHRNAIHHLWRDGRSVRNLDAAESPGRGRSDKRSRRFEKFPTLEHGPSHRILVEWSETGLDCPRCLDTAHRNPCRRRGGPRRRCASSVAKAFVEQGLVSKCPGRTEKSECTNVLGPLPKGI
jgi:hypothetical protein